MNNFLHEVPDPGEYDGPASYSTAFQAVQAGHDASRVLTDKNLNEQLAQANAATSGSGTGHSEQQPEPQTFPPETTEVGNETVRARYVSESSMQGQPGPGDTSGEDLAAQDNSERVGAVPSSENPQPELEPQTEMGLGPEPDKPPSIRIADEIHAAATQPEPAPQTESGDEPQPGILYTEHAVYIDPETGAARPYDPFDPSRAYDVSPDNPVFHPAPEQPSAEDEREAAYQAELSRGHEAYAAGDNAMAIWQYTSAIFGRGDNVGPHEMIDLPEYFGDRVALVEQVEVYDMPRHVNGNRAIRARVEKLDIGGEGQERAHLSGHYGEQTGLNVTFTYPLGGELKATLCWPDGANIDGSIDQFTSDVESRGEDLRNVAKVAELLNLATTLGRPLSPEEYGQFSFRDQLQAARLRVWEVVKNLKFSRTQ